MMEEAGGEMMEEGGGGLMEKERWS